MNTLQFMNKRVYFFVCYSLKVPVSSWGGGRGCGRLELGVGLVCLSQDLLSFIAGQALLSGELEGLEA